MNGRFVGTTILMMGYNRLTFSLLAGAFVEKGAEACVDSDGSVSADCTDVATTSSCNISSTKVRQYDKHALVDFENDDCHVKTAKSLREDEELISARLWVPH